MKDFFIELWKALPKPIRAFIVPLCIGISIIALYYLIVDFITSNKQFQSIAKETSFKTLVFLIVISLTTFYTISYLKKGRLKILGWIVLPLLLSVETFYYLRAIKKYDCFTIHFYQYGQENYDSDILKLCATEINDLYPSFKLIFHNRRYWHEDGMQVSSDSIIKTLREDRPQLSPKEVAIAITSKMLHTTTTYNLFSVSTKQYSAVSTKDWEYKKFKPIAIYKYLINVSLQCLIVSISRLNATPITYHNEDETTGCVFDYTYEKTAIRGSIIRPKICENHGALIKNLLGDQFYNDFHSAIADMPWWKNIEKEVKIIE